MAAPGPYKPEHTVKERSWFLDLFKRKHSKWAGQRENAKVINDAIADKDSELGQSAQLVPGNKTSKASKGERRSRRHSMPSQGHDTAQRSKDRRRHSDIYSKDDHALKNENVSKHKIESETGDVEYTVFKAHKKVSRSHSVGSKRTPRSKSEVQGHGCTSPNCACSVVREYTARLALEDQQKGAKLKRSQSEYAERSVQVGQADLGLKKSEVNSRRPKYENVPASTSSSSSQVKQASSTSDFGDHHHVSDNIHNESQERSTEGSKDGINTSLEVQPTENDLDVSQEQHMREIVRQNSENSFAELRRMSYPVKTPLQGSVLQEEDTEDTARKIQDNSASKESSQSEGKGQETKRKCGYKGCSSPNCACAVVQQYTLQGMRQGEIDKSAKVQKQDKSDAVEKWLKDAQSGANSTKDDQPQDQGSEVKGHGDQGSKAQHPYVELLRNAYGGARPKSYQDKSANRPTSKHNRPHTQGCTSPNCACNVVKEYTRKLLLDDKEKQLEGDGGLNVGDLKLAEAEIGSRQMCSDLKRSIAMKGDHPETDRDSKQDGAFSISDLHLENAEVGSRQMCSQITEQVKQREKEFQTTVDVHHDQSSDSADRMKSHSKKTSPEQCSPSGCTSPNCACATVREYTEKLLRQDYERKRARQKQAREELERFNAAISANGSIPQGHRSNSHSRRSRSYSEGDKSVRSSAQRRSTTSDHSHRPRTVSCFPMLMDKRSFKEMSKQYNVKKQPHRTKRVLVKKNQYHDKTEVAKYKSLVEVRDSIPDLLKAAIEDKERRREIRKDQRKARNRQIKHNVKEALWSSSDYALRRQSKLPYYSSYPSNRKAPPLPALMNKLPNPPVYFREDTV